MVWLKNLLFLGLCLGGLGALAAGLSPVHRQTVARRAHRYESSFADVAATAQAADATFRQQRQEHQLVPANRADDLAIARRLSLALVGAIPSLEEIREFEAQPAATRIAWYTDQLLADRRSSDYLAERFARALVGTKDGPFIVYRRRRFVNWLSDELHANQPYDQIVRHVIADTGLWTDRPATNFITVTIVQDNDNKDPNRAELAARVSRAFLGVRIDCAECHDHPFQNWKQRDFQQLAAFFKDTKQSLIGIRDLSGTYEYENRKTGEKIKAEPKAPFHQELLPSNNDPWRARLATWITHPKNEAFSRATVNRIWAMMFGRGLVEPIDDLRAHQDEAPPALAILADDFAQHGYDLRRLVRTIAATEVFQLDSRSTSDSEGKAEQQAELELAESLWTRFPITRLRPEQVVGGLLQSSSLTTIGSSSHILVKFMKATQQNDFITRFGDLGENELVPQGATVPQRLLMMNGALVKDRTQESMIFNASTQVARFATTDEKAVELAYLTVLTRRPSDEERSYFTDRLTKSTEPRHVRLEDLYWTLLNSTEFAWNH